MNNDLEMTAVRRLVRVDEVAHILQVSQRHVRGLVASGRIASVRIGRSVRVTRDEVERVAREGISESA